jgi:hypothetical protein
LLTLSEWADVALIFLLAQVFIVGIAGGISVFYTIRGFTRLDKELRFRLPLLREQMKRTAITADVVAEQIREPIIAAGSGLAQAERIVASLSSVFKRK